MPREMGIFETMYNCRAMRRLKPDPVPEPILIKMIAAANQAPTGSNRQGARWIIVRDAKQRRKLADLNRARAMGYVGPDPTPPTAHPADKRDRLVAAVRWQGEHMQDIPALVIACYRFEESVVDNPAITARAAGSIWPAIQNLLLAARALGLGATPTTMGLSDRAAVREVLRLPDDMAAFCLIPVGYPYGNFGPVTRLPVEETMRWDLWEE